MQSNDVLTPPCWLKTKLLQSHNQRMSAIPSVRVLTCTLLAVPTVNNLNVTAFDSS